MLRNRLRTLEQHVNSADLPDDVKVKLQGYISGCYGTLTSFNVLFAEEDGSVQGRGRRLRSRREREPFQASVVRSAEASRS